MAIGGGALVVVQGTLADAWGLQRSFALTAVCELYVLFYALWGSKPSQALASRPLADERVP
jgi:FHS family L-fucose permease-like MFS transporter